ncbi:MAG: CRISPR-associated helicase Cas3' [Candidatus Bathyarchaeia archaeon]
MESLFEKIKPVLSTTLTHGKHGVDIHCEEVKSIFLMLCTHYRLSQDCLKKLGCFISLYHDVAKPYVKLGKPHAEPSARVVFENRSCFTTTIDPALVLIGTYLIACHHTRLRKTGHFLDRQQPSVSVTKCLQKILEKHKVYPCDVADAFGLFKLADVFSASGHDCRRLLNKPSITTDKIKEAFKNIDGERWNEQLQLKYAPSISILRAPTGWGKTTASFLFAAEKEVNRIFLLLPTITAIRALYETLSRVYGEENVSEYFYLYDAEVAENEELLGTLFLARSFLSPIVITTTDQFLLTFLQIGKYYNKRLNFRNSVLIFDEVHLMSPTMFLLTTFFIQRFAEKYNLRCLFMSATFPEAYRHHLGESLEAYHLDFGNKYKQLKRVMYEFSTHTICDSVIDDIGKKVKDRANVLVVVNTVPKAALVAQKLEELIGNENVLLLHARFTNKDRREHERQMHIKLRENNPHVLVATQVCGVSLDVSYNYIYTELAPLGDVIQRFGRVNRYGRSTAICNAFIFEPENSEPYEESELDISRAVLEQFNGHNLKNEKQLLDEFDRQFTFEEFLKLSGKPVNMDGEAFIKQLSEYYEKENLFFYSTDFTEIVIKKVLEYKDRLTTLALPNPEIITADDQRKNLEKAIEEWINRDRDDYNSNVNILAKLKRFLIPVPLRYIDRNEAIKDIPFPNITRGQYSSRYGYLIGGSDP